MEPEPSNSLPHNAIITINPPTSHPNFGTYLEIMSKVLEVDR